MESKNRKADRKSRRQLATLLLAGTLTSLPCVAGAEPVEVSDSSGLNTALSTVQEDGILLKTVEEGVTEIKLTETLTVGVSNQVDLGGVTLTQGGQKIGFSKSGETLTFTDSKPGENGSGLNFSSFELDGELQPATVVLDGIENSFGNGLTIQGLNFTADNASYLDIVGDMNVNGTSDLKIVNGSAIYVNQLETETLDENGEGTGEFTVSGGNLNLTLNARTVTLDSKDSDYQSILSVEGKTTINATANSNMEVLNGSYAKLGDVELTINDSDDSMTFTVDGKAEFKTSSETESEEASTQEYGATLEIGALTQIGDGKANFQIQNGGSLYIDADLTFNETDSKTVLLKKDADAEAGSVLSLGGTLTVNENFTVGTGTDADFETVSANTLDVANNADSSVNFTVKDGKTASFGTVTGAQGENSSLTVTLSGGSTFGAMTSEDDTEGTIWTGVLTLGSTTGGDVNISLADKSNLVAGKSYDITLQDGNIIEVADGSQIYGAESGNFTANSGTVTMNITGASVVSSEDKLTLTANSDAIMDVNVTGIDAENQSFLSSSGDFTLGGKGTLNVTANDGVVMGSLTKMTVGTDAEGTVNYTIAGKNSYAYVGDPNSTAGEEAEGSGILTLGQHGTVNVKVADSATLIGQQEVIVAENAEAEVSVELANNGAIQSDRGNVIIGQAGTATVLGTGSLLAAQKMVIGQKKDAVGNVNLKNSYVEAHGLVVGEEEGANGEFSLSGNKSTLHILASDEELKAEGNGKITISGVTSTDYSSCVFLEKGAQMHANDGIMLKDSYLYVTSDTLISAKNGGVNVSNGSIINGYEGDVNVVGNLTITDSTVILGIATDGSSNQINVTEGDLKIDNTKLEVYFTDNGTITGQEWDLVNVDEGYNTEINWADEVVSPLDIYGFAVSDDGTKLSMTLKNEYFNSRANTLQLARQSLWNAVEDRVTWNSDGIAYCGQKSPFYNYDERSSFWMKSGYRGTDVKGRNGYNIDAFNMTVGVDSVFEEYLAAGAFFSFSNPEMEEDHESANAENYSFGLYGGYKTWGGFELKGMMAYTLSDYSMYRNMGSAGGAETEFRGSTLTASVEMARPFYFGSLVLRPLFAVDTECVWQEDAVENGSYAMYYEKNNDTWTYARLGGKLEFTPTQRFILRGKAFYAIQLDDDGASETNGRFVGTSENLHMVGADVGDDYFNLGISAAFMFNERFSAFADYDGYYADESESHVVHGGSQVNF